MRSVQFTYIKDTCKMLLPDFCGGLGNMLWQAAGTYCIAKQTGHAFGILDIPLHPEKHSCTDYTTNILKPLKSYVCSERPVFTTVHEAHAQPLDVDFLRAHSNETIQLKGYLQHTSYIHHFRDEVLKLFELPQVNSKYEELETAYFLHCRRGDYVNHWYHELNLDSYYPRALSRMQSGLAYIVSNDAEWCESWSLLQDVRHVIVKDNEVDSLALMAACGQGGIAVNSSFSWWGLYLNLERPRLLLPNRWYPHNIEYDTSRYYFPGCTIVTI